MTHGAAPILLLRLPAVGENVAMLATLGILDWVILTMAVVLLLPRAVDAVRRGPRWPTPTAWPQHPPKRIDKPGQPSERR